MSKAKVDYGSQNAIQVLANLHPEVFAAAIGSNNIRWISPLKADNYKEYSNNFPELEIDKVELSNKWAARGPHWDGIAIDKENDEYLIIEAKAHISEIFNTDSQAKEASSKTIREQLKGLANRLSAKRFISEMWGGSLYQMANRLWYLDYLNKNACTRWRNKVRLVYLVFIDDPIAKKMQLCDATETKEAWKAAIHIAEHQMLFLPKRHKLTKYIKHIFIKSPSILHSTSH